MDEKKDWGKEKGCRRGRNGVTKKRSEGSGRD